jgi:5-methyltetrahydrofolate--homocysteine methyltransferase
MGRIIESIRSRGPLVSDGAWGTFLYQKGLGVSEAPESWNLSHPELVLEVAQSYVEAGADLILTNSFGGSPQKLEGYGLNDKTYEINRSAAEISRKAAGERVWVLGSIGPTGKMLMMGETTPEEMLEGFAVQARGLADGGVDAFVVETMSDLEEASVAIQAIKRESELEVACTFTFSRTQSGEYRTMMGTGVGEYLSMARGAGVDIVGANCGNGTAGMIEIVREIRALDQEIPVLVHANAGLPVYQDGKTVFPESPEEMATQIRELVTAGANIVGGCCGTTPEHIRYICRYIKEGRQ